MSNEESTVVLSVFGVTERPVRSRMPKTIYLYHPERMTDGGFWPGRTRPWKEKKLIFGRQCRVEEDQSSRTFPPQRPRH